MPLSRAKEFKDVVLGYEANGNVLIEWLTDLPGGAMAVRASKTVGTTSAERKPAIMPLDGVEGNFYKLRVTPQGTTVCKLFWGRVRLKVIGVYLDGAQNEKFETEELSLAG